MVLQATELHWLTASEAARAFRSREVSPVELTRHLLERSGRLQDSLHAFVTLTPEIALGQARVAEAALLRGDDGPPLLGIPVGYKDIYFTEGVLTTAGSQLQKDFVPEMSATAVARMQAAGAVMLGKLTTWEFASGGSDLLESYFASARNPWDPAHTPAGSSSGSGVALAAGLVTTSLGTDTGGSIRGPAAACGVVGLKPTFGRVSRYGVFPAAWSLDHTGPMARTVEDCAIILSAIAGPDPLDPACATEPVHDYTLGLNRPIAGLRVGLPSPEYFAACHPDHLAALNRSVDLLRDLGAVVSEIAMPQPSPAVSAEAHAYHRADLLETPGMFGAKLAERNLGGGAYFASEYIQMQRLRSLLKEEMRRLLLTVDVIVTPTAGIPPMPMEEAIKHPFGSPVNVSFTRIWNQAGLPALSIPNGFSGDGLPISLQIAGRPFDEATVLRVGHALERATDWHTRHPDL